MSDIHKAALEGDLKAVQNILADTPKAAASQNEDDGNKTPLHWAIAFQHVEIVMTLLEALRKQKIDLDDLTDDSGWNPLHTAASIGNIDIVDAILHYDPAPDVDQTTSNGQTALHFAVSKNFKDTVELLLENKASVRIKDKKGQYPIHRAASIGSLSLIKLLAQKSSPLNFKDIYGFTPLHHALSEGHADAAVLLAELGADKTIEDSEGHVPLQVAVDEKTAVYFKQHTE
ncbi:BA75_04034T0 [Komagataella pastoris]|uniref:BA75_04034T0 n=1 Tax=Komagataella pastoris TaxID=4922 RepID=A0A1B2JHD4_PICPA|nr:BA75_04034T0 [Komagataella pastoris]